MIKSTPYVLEADHNAKRDIIPRHIRKITRREEQTRPLTRRHKHSSLFYDWYIEEK